MTVVGAHFLDFQNAYMFYSKCLLLRALSKNSQSVTPGSYPVGHTNIKKKRGGGVTEEFRKRIGIVYKPTRDFWATLAGNCLIFTLFWDPTPCRLVAVDRRFRRTYVILYSPTAKMATTGFYETGALLLDYTASHPKGFLVRWKPISDCPQNDLSLTAVRGNEN